MKLKESFDVFDTVLTRIVGCPESVFVLMGKKLLGASLISIPPHEFARLRVQAETQARRKCGWGEVTLETIHHELGDLLALSETQRLHVMGMECEMEERLLRVVPDAVNQVLEARRRHGGVIYISDMYLPRSVIHGWLVQHKLWEEGDRLYLSNEAGVSKASGQLFQLVLADERMAAERLVHRGNHPQVDVAVPARMGIQRRPFPEGNLNRYETLMESHAISTGGWSSVLAGSSRLARLSVLAVNETEQALCDVSAGVMSPLLVSYVLWILQRARELSLRRLYFLSRDGQILLEIARRLAPKLKMNIDLRYLYASRQSWHLPGVTRIDATKLEWICTKYDFLSLRSLLFRVGVGPEEVAEEIAKVRLPASDWDRQLTPAELEQIKTLLSAGQLHDLILSRAAAKREVFLGYLRQEGVMDHNHWALIDVGWHGRLQASLGEVLATVGQPTPRGFYFDLHTRPSAASAGAFEAYFFDSSNRGERPQFSRVDIPTLLEIACAANHGSVDGFVERNGRFEAVLRGDGNAPVREWGVSIMQDAICRFADCLVLDDELVDASQDIRPVVAELIRAFWENPTRQEAEVWGRFPFENDQSGTAYRPIAKPYSADAVFRALLGRTMGKPFVSFWQDGSIMISPPAIRVALQVGTRVKRFLRKRLCLST